MNIADYRDYISVETMMRPSSARILEELLERHPVRQDHFLSFTAVNRHRAAHLVYRRMEVPHCPSGRTFFFQEKV